MQTVVRGGATLRGLVYALVVLAAMAPARLHVAPVIDGHLDDAAWHGVRASDAFTQSWPHDGDAPTQPTRVKVGYDDENIYIAVDCRQTAPPVVRLTRRDRVVEGDRITIDLDTSHDRRSAFHFEVSAAGVLVDGLRYDDTELSSEWDDVWRAEVAHDAHGWTAEIEIPLRILRLHADVTTWGFQVRRWTSAIGEEDLWAYSPRDAGGEVSRYGELGPFEGLAPHSSLALVPFVLTRLVRADADVPSPYGNGLSAAAGIDATWRPASGITLQAAVLPDFGQVEADQIVINLTTTETEYPEKRPFFLQGMDLFQTPIQLLYTRRIGRAAVDPVLPQGVAQVGAVGSAEVLGAAKLVATAGALDIGALSVATGDVEAAVTGAGGGGGADGVGGHVLAEPSASHHVLRLRATDDGLTVGALATAQLQSDDPARHPIVGGLTSCPSGATVTYGERCSHDAVTGGVDAAWRSDEGTWTASGQLAGTRADGGPERVLLDGTHLRSGDGGVGGAFRVAKEGGTLRGDIDYEGYSRRFDIDDLGYLERSNVHHLQMNVEAYSPRPHGPLLDQRARLELFFRRNLDGLTLPSGYQVNLGGTTKNLWEVWAELHWRPAYFDDRELADGRSLERSGRLGLEVEVTTDARKAISGTWSSALRSTHDGWELYASGALRLQPRDNVEIELMPDLLFTRGEPRFVDGSDPAGPRFARQDASSLGVTTRVTWTLERDLTVQAYVQALLASIRYRDPFVADPDLKNIDLDALRVGAFDAGMYDAREGALDATIVGRWEYRPGSTAYLVYSHAQRPLDGVGWEPHALVRGPASDAVLCKLSWAWLR